MLDDFPLGSINERPHGLPYSAYELLWHLRFAQRDILNFVQDSAYQHVDWPDGYWPHTDAATEADWHAQKEQFWADQGKLLELLDSPQTDLFAVVPGGAAPGGKGQTWLREFLLVADHNAYHAGQLMLLKRLLS